MAQVTLGDRASFDTIVQRHAPAVWRLARAMAPSDAEAADIVQEALLAAFKSADTYRPGVSSVRTWLFSIARNAARRARRLQREHGVEVPEPSLLQLGVDAGWGAEDEATRYEQHELLVRAMAALAPEDLEIVLLRDVEGLRGEEAAEVLGIGLAAVKSRLHRARLRLMAAMRASEGGVLENEREHGGLSCSEVLARLGDYVDGDLAISERSRVDAHLRGCSVCERFGGRYAGVVQSARVRLGASDPVDPTHLERIRRALEQASLA